MSTVLFNFKDMPNIEFEIERTTVFATEIQTGASGVEQRASFNALPRYKYKATIICRTYANGDEVAYVNNLFEMHYGTYDSFYVLDPITGMEVNVRFDMDELKWKRFGAHNWWKTELEMISVKGSIHALQPEADGISI